MVCGNKLGDSWVRFAADASDFGSKRNTCEFYQLQSLRKSIERHRDGKRVLYVKASLEHSESVIFGLLGSIAGRDLEEKLWGVFFIIFEKFEQGGDPGMFLVHISVRMDVFVVDDEGRSSFEVSQVADIEVLKP